MNTSVSFRNEIINNIEDYIIKRKSTFPERRKGLIQSFLDRINISCENFHKVDTRLSDIEIINESYNFFNQQSAMPPTIQSEDSHEGYFIFIPNPNLIIDQSDADKIAKHLLKLLHFYQNNGKLNKKAYYFIRLLKDFDGHIDANFVELYIYFMENEKKFIKGKPKDTLNQHLKKTETIKLPYPIINNIITGNSSKIPPIENSNNKSQEEK